MTKTDKYARMDERSTANVVTVSPSHKGNAACIEERPLFEKIETSGRVSRADRRKAARVCAGCALRESCGYRITAPPSPTTRRTES